MPRNQLTTAQRVVYAEIESLSRLFAVDWPNIELYPPPRRLERLRLIRNQLVRSQVIMQYAFLDELLAHRIIRAYFDVGRGRKLWRTKRFKVFNHHVLEELGLLQKLENLKRSKPVWAGHSLFTLAGATAMENDLRKVTDELWPDFEAYGKKRRGTALRTRSSVNAVSSGSSASGTNDEAPPAGRSTAAGA